MTRSSTWGSRSLKKHLPLSRVCVWPMPCSYRVRPLYLPPGVRHIPGHTSPRRERPPSFTPPHRAASSLSLFFHLNTSAIPFSFLFSFTEVQLANEIVRYLKCTAWWFDTGVHWERENWTLGCILERYLGFPRRFQWGWLWRQDWERKSKEMGSEGNAGHLTSGISKSEKQNF